MKSERMHDYLSRNDITWQFNLSQASWLGGQFERLVGLVKQALYKLIGGANLTRSELEEVILDTEIALNSRPLSACADTSEHDVWSANLLPKEDVDSVEDKDLRKCVRHLWRCKGVLWS